MSFSFRFSSLDLSLCHPSLLLDFDWSVSEDQHGSDHFHIVIESVIASAEDHNPKWKLNKAKWEQFHSLCNNFLDIENFDNSTDLVADFTSSLTDISNRCIPNISTNPKKKQPMVGWLVGCGFNGPLRQYFSLYRAVSQREGERGKKDR